MIDWNTDEGRVIWWLRRWQKTRSHASERALRAFWQIAVEEIGETATRDAVEGAGLDLPAWLDGKGVEVELLPVYQYR